MKTLTFNKNSFHYKLAGFGIDAFHDVSEDICGYVRQVIAGLMNVHEHIPDMDTQNTPLKKWR